MPEWLQSPSDAENLLDRGLGLPIAVLPIRTPGSSSELLFAANRITSALTDTLSQVKGLRVRAETTVRNTFTRYVDPQKAGESLGVCTFLCGELSVHDHELLLRIEAIDVNDSTQLCAAEIETAFPLEKHIEKSLVQEIVKRLKPRLLALAAPNSRQVRRNNIMQFAAPALSPHSRPASAPPSNAAPSFPPAKPPGSVWNNPRRVGRLL